MNNDDMVSMTFGFETWIRKSLYYPRDSCVYVQLPDGNRKQVHKLEVNGNGDFIIHVH